MHFIHELVLVRYNVSAFSKYMFFQMKLEYNTGTDSKLAITFILSFKLFLSIKF